MSTEDATRSGWQLCGPVLVGYIKRTVPGLPGSILNGCWQGEVPVVASPLAMGEAVLGSCPRGPPGTTTGVL